MRNLLRLCRAGHGRHHCRSVTGDVIEGKQDAAFAVEKTVDEDSTKLYRITFNF